MKKKNTVLSPLAEQDMLDIWEYTSGDDEVRANIFLNSLQETLFQISDFPFSGVSRNDVREELRLIVFQHYNIFYSVENGCILVVRILHGSREVKRFF